MKFKKRVLMYLAIVGIILAPSMAKAGDSEPLNKWMVEIPVVTEMDSLSEVVSARFAPIRGPGQSIKRRQKFYMAFYDTGGTTYVNTNGTTTECTGTISGTTCASAPLFIAGDSALLCVDGNIESVTADALNTIRVHICADSTCTDAKSIYHGGYLKEDAWNACGQGGSVGNAAQFRNSHSIGGEWIYVELITASGPASGTKTLVWITGK